MVNINEIYEKAICYANGDNTEKCSVEEKENIIETFLEVMQKKQLSEEEFFKIDQLYTSLWVIGAQNDFRLKNLRKIVKILSDIEKDYYIEKNVY